jgi:hypothetical protein
MQDKIMTNADLFLPRATWSHSRSTRTRSAPVSRAFHDRQNHLSLLERAQPSRAMC